MYEENFNRGGSRSTRNNNTTRVFGHSIWCCSSISSRRFVKSVTKLSFFLDLWNDCGVLLNHKTLSHFNVIHISSVSNHNRILILYYTHFPLVFTSVLGLISRSIFLIISCSWLLQCSLVVFSQGGRFYILKDLIFLWWNIKIHGYQSVLLYKQFFPNSQFTQIFNKIK